MARGGSLRLPGFPEFEQVVSELKQSSNDIPSPDFQVCIPVPNGLVIKQNLVDYWASCDMFSNEIASLVAEHNKKYNPQGLKRGHAEGGSILHWHSEVLSNMFFKALFWFHGFHFNIFRFVVCNSMQLLNIFSSYFEKDQGGESNEEAPAAKKLKVDKTVKLAEHEATIQEKFLGHWKMFFVLGMFWECSGNVLFP